MPLRVVNAVVTAQSRFNLLVRRLTENRYVVKLSDFASRFGPIPTFGDEFGGFTANSLNSSKLFLFFMKFIDTQIDFFFISLRRAIITIAKILCVPKKYQIITICL